MTDFKDFQNRRFDFMDIMDQEVCLTHLHFFCLTDLL